MPSASQAVEASPEPCELSIVMPCLNEEETLETCIRMCQAFLESHGVEVHTYAGTQICINGSGGPTCLTRPVERR